MLPRDVYSQPDAPDPVLDGRTVLSLVKRHVPHAQAVTAVDESGGEARAYAIDDGLILKTQRPQQVRPRTSLEKEAAFLLELAAFPEIRVPRVLGYGREGGVEYLCMTRVPGVAARHTSLWGAERAKLLREVGRTLWSIHNVPQAPLHDSALFPGPRTAPEFRRRFEAGLAQALSAIKSDPSLWTLDISPAQLASTALETLPPLVPLVALHSNPGPEHIFIDPDTLTFTGLIDFGDAYIGHPAFDWRWPEYDDRLAILEGYREDSAADEDFLAAWRSVMVFAEMTALATRPERRIQAIGHLVRLSYDLLGRV